MRTTSPGNTAVCRIKDVGVGHPVEDPEHEQQPSALGRDVEVAPGLHERPGLIGSLGQHIASAVVGPRVNHHRRRMIDREHAADLQAVVRTEIEGDDVPASGLVRIVGEVDDAPFESAFGRVRHVVHDFLARRRNKQIPHHDLLARRDDHHGADLGIAIDPQRFPGTASRSRGSRCCRSGNTRPGR